MNTNNTQAFQRRQFASDNYAGVCPEAWQALEAANRGHAQSYGEDAWTQQASDAIRELFGRPCEVFFVFNGTAANSLALASLCQSYHGVICHEMAHVETDECGAPEFFSNGTKLLLAGGADGKIIPAEIERLVLKRADIHYPKPRVVSITQSTEVGTVYSLEELRDIRETVRRLGLVIHIDGSRFFNALVTAGCQPIDFIHASGADVLCLGGTKLGLSCGEAVVFFNRSLAVEFAYRCKQAGQLASKMRFMTAQWTGLLSGGAWRNYAANANKMAMALRDELSALPDLRFPYPSQANSVFVEASPAVFSGLRDRGWRFYEFIGGAARFMCSWDTTQQDVSALAADFRNVYSLGETQAHNSEILRK